MLRGEFVRGDGLVIPNNITKLGAELILKAAMQGVTPTFFLALGKFVPDIDLQLEDLAEPTIGVNGYARIGLAQDDTDWPDNGFLNNEAYVESKSVVWTASGGDFDKPVTRIALVNNDDQTDGDIVIAASSAFPELVITPTTDEVLRTFKYRIYLR